MANIKYNRIEWVGNSTEQLNVIRCRFLYSIIGGNGFKESMQGKVSGDFPFCKVSDINSNDIYVSNANNYVNQTDVEENSYNIIPAGSIIFAKIGEALKKNHRKINTVKCIIDNNMQALVAKVDINNIFYYFVWKCIDMNWFDNGGTIPSINNQLLLNIELPYPALNKQTAIASYLNNKCAEIDSVIKAKERTNELLKEQRQSIIYEAVTKGIDKNAPMKDSRIEWIGDIPEDWKLEKLKYHAMLNPSINLTMFNLDDDDDVSFIPMENLKNGFHTLSSSSFQKVKNGYVQFENGDILIAKVTPCFENGNLAIATGLNKGVGFGSTEINVIRCQSINSNFLFYYFQNQKFIERGKYDMYGVAGLKRLIPLFITDSYYPIPSEPEQQKIVEYLNIKCAEIDQVINSNNSIIEELKEYRQSLIYEAVTGKVEVY